MFRTMRRFKQELTREECLAVLRSQPRGVLSLLGENGYPYGLHFDYWYNVTVGKLYFHGDNEVHKIE
uniref:pyridoxamine 5'-phosphate oxidase family protein n=1 Tax=uncultured Gemmiger sp. TaxID=1623490 RepID=UPI0034A09E58